MKDIQKFYGLKKGLIFSNDVVIITEKCALEKFEYFMIEVGFWFNSIGYVFDIDEDDYHRIFNLLTSFKQYHHYVNGYVDYNDKYTFVFFADY